MQYKEAVELYKQAYSQDSSKLLALGLWGMGKYRYNKANELGALPENRMKTAKALAELRKMKLIPKNTYIATNPKQFEYYASHLGYNRRDNQNEYWMYPLYRTGKDGKDRVSGAFSNAPENEHGMVNFPALRHELGHARDYLNGDAEEADHQGAMARFGDLFRGVFDPLGTAKGGKERRAWDLAGIPEGDKMREAALDTYRLALRTELAKYVIPVLGIAGGVVPAGLLAKPDIGAQLDNIEKINMEGLGAKARPMKQLGKTRQAVVLQGMPAKLRNQVASVDNEMDGDYLVTLNDGSQAVYTPGEKEFY